MKKLFIIDGAAGTGKSEFISYVDEKLRASAKVIQKITTREQRYEDEFKKKDLRFVCTKDLKPCRAEARCMIIHTANCLTEKRLPATGS